MKDFLRHNGILLLIAAVLLAAVVAIASALMPAAPTLLGNALGVIAAPLRAGVSTVAVWIQDQYNRSANYDALVEENQRLREENARLQREAREAVSDSKENEELRNLLELREKRREFSLESATILSRSATSWESSLTLSKGSIHDVEAGDCVIDSQGNLVGVVSEVGVNWCSVTTLLDPELEMGALIFRTDNAAILEGDFGLMPEGKLKLSYLPDNDQLISGDVVLTSGKGGVYPPRLMVGTVDEVRTEESGMSRYAVLTPAADLKSLTQVFIIKSFDIVE
ncbi:MAG: rod shape-determining protein MreC [Oscillospiraceae bacterium]|nr:rod shape-determining protein MreC [Oscillospiraceae bacterium]